MFILKTNQTCASYTSRGGKKPTEDRERVWMDICQSIGILLTPVPIAGKHLLKAYVKDGFGNLEESPIWTPSTGQTGISSPPPPESITNTGPWYLTLFGTRDVQCPKVAKEEATTFSKPQPKIKDMDPSAEK
ncbi:hypothetical protein FKM82_026237 [Ascaphus truei]